MNIILGIIANVVEQMAEMGAGFLSWGIAYQPEIPEELMKNEEA